MSATSVWGCAIWWMLMRQRQVRCNLQWSVPERLEWGTTIKALYKYTSFTGCCHLVNLVAWSQSHCPSGAGLIQGDHLSGKPGNVREFDSCRGNVKDFTKSQGIVREKILSGKSGLKLFIVNCIFVSVQIFSGSLFCSVLNIKYMVLGHALLHSYPHHWQ